MTDPLPIRLQAILSPVPQDRVIARFGLAVAMAVLAVLLRALLDPVLGHVAFYTTVVMAVAYCAVVCGFAPGVLCGLLGFLGIFYWFVDPRYSLLVVRRSELHAVVGFFLVAAVLIALGAANRRKELKLDETIVALKEEAGERRHAQQELREAHDVLEHRVAERTAELLQALNRLESEVTVRKLAEEQLRRLSIHLMTLQDEERRRIARELHDSAGQTLAAIKMTVASIERLSGSAPNLMRLVNDLNALTDAALQEVRTASYLLHPPLLDEAGIASAARWFVEGFAKRSGIQVRCDVPERMERPPRECELVLFRVLQESLTNVHRHSGASHTSIKLSLDAGQFRLEVSDNGRGIPEEHLRRFRDAAGSSGVGIAGMRERVRELRGRLDIESDQTGTTVNVTLPMLKTSDAGEAGIGVSAA